eukprot:GHUV01014936.1.p1 GENE.GHUV01014936.1~~GHUV01014936.1.p1  ORF type:complete len:415 (+),score=64.43 GHUV01014936.1:364-1608(+)
MVGAGVLGLPAALAVLGWAGGILFLIFSFWVSWHTYKLLVYMHEVPDLDCKAGNGIRRLDRYDQLAEYVFGPKRGKAILLPFQMAVLVGIAVTYNVVGGDNLAAFAGAVSPVGPVMGGWAYYIMFGGLQLLLSMLPSFDDLRMVSLLGALMSLAYCTIAVAMSATVNPGTSVNYSPALVHKAPVKRVMDVFNALTTVFFAYGGHNVALEIQATIPCGGTHPSSTVSTMMKGVNVTFLLTGLCYFGVSIVGFWAFGTAVSENVLMAFAHGPTHWVVSMAQMMVVIHVASAYQVYTQPVFSLLEARIQRARGGVEVPVHWRCCLRLVYVGLIALVAILVPFFGALMGLIGAIAITPTTFLLPPLLWVLLKQPNKWGLEWSINWALVWITGLLGVLGTVGSIYSIADSWSTFKLFAN